MVNKVIKGLAIFIIVTIVAAVLAFWLYILVGGMVIVIRG